ncbi:hypothetical protein Taro_008771 [Colocasia esculenta]|uniref:FBD domain-containing protein n=1 Tax=Colocasia esculenta TaxID=4460 RepID=A0A843TZ31_COLES|nr:hypothetical protein [Colocasia esculenta]
MLPPFLGCWPTHGPLDKTGANRGVQYKVPSSLFSFESLKYLKLSNCNISIPSEFRSFDMLTYLHLAGVHFTDNGLQNLLSKYPRLTSLELIGLFCISFLEILAPNLKKLWFSGVFIDLYFDTPSLSKLHFYLIDSVPILKVGAQNRGMPVLLRSFQRMGNIETLGLCGSTLKFILLCTPQESLELACSHVKTLRLTLNYEDRRETVALLHLLRDCPLLQYLEIMTESHQATAMVSIGSYWETMDYPDYTFGRLRDMRMTAFSATVPELELMRYILANSTMLETLTLEPTEEIPEHLEVLKEMLMFQRASKYAAIVWVDPQGTVADAVV